MKTIIVPTDFSPVSVNALDFAVGMARNINARILLFHVYNIPVAISEVPVALASVDDLKAGSEGQLNDLKERIDLLFPGQTDIICESRLGNTMDELEKRCKEIQPFAVIMGTKGKSGLEKILGSTTLTAIRHLTCPVIAIPPGKQYGNGIKKIGLACDFREISSTMPVNPIKEMVQLFSAELHILNVDYKDRRFRTGTPAEMFYLHSAFEDIKPRYHFIDHPDIEDGILEFVRENNLDLIIAIPKKHKLLEGIFKPSSTRQLVFQTIVPVMCVHEY